jgi:NADH-quinone oxidoreductase subunit J
MIAIIATAMAISRKNGVHALLYLIVSFLAVAVIFYTMGAPFIAALEVIVYAGAIIVLLVFVTMMVNLGKEGVKKESQLLRPATWVLPVFLTLVLFGEFLYLLMLQPDTAMEVQEIAPRYVGQSLFTDYLIVVEMAAMLLMAGIIGAYHLGKTKKATVHRYLRDEQNEEDA